MSKHTVTFIGGGVTVAATGKPVSVEYITGQVRINTAKNEVDIYRMNGNWDVYEYLSTDDIPGMLLNINVGRHLRCDYRG